MMKRESAWSLLGEYTQSEGLRKHMLAVEACMRAYAEKFSEDVEKYGVTGLLHDFDYEKYPTPQEHPFVGNNILEERGWPEDIRRAILSHAEYSGVSRQTNMEKALFACDELAGFITATALVKPSKSLAEVEAKSVRKKMKDKAFARSVSRDDIINGAAELGVDLEEHIAFCIEAKKMIARFAPTELKVDTSKLSAGDQKALARLVAASRIFDEIFIDQLWSKNRATYAQLKKDQSPLGRERQHYYWINKGPWSDLDE